MQNYQLEEVTTTHKLRSQIAELFRGAATTNPAVVDTKLFKAQAEITVRRRRRRGLYALGIVFLTSDMRCLFEECVGALHAATSLDYQVRGWRRGGENY